MPFHSFILLTFLMLFGVSHSWTTYDPYTGVVRSYSPPLPKVLPYSGPCSTTITGVPGRRKVIRDCSTNEQTNIIRPPMGQRDSECDDGKSNLNIDWDESRVNYTCYSRRRLPIRMSSSEECVYVPDNYAPQHKCMNEKLEYSTPHPTHGDHRPLWAVYGEYRFVPPQRWLHNVEHGAVVMLYHPCADPTIVDELRTVVTGCIRKHIIAADTNVDPTSPLVLIAWGCKLSMSYVDKQEVEHFIIQRAMKGPEGNLADDGQYSKHLLKRAVTPYGSDYKDSNICPGHIHEDTDNVLPYSYNNWGYATSY